jgi:hypothetical protein
MIFERRRYTARAGMHDEFIRLQRVRGFDGAIGAIMARLIGYFTTVSGASEQFVHLYRYDDFTDWLNRLHGLYGVPELEPYFRDVRPILSSQETDFFLPAPIDDLVPLWSGRNDWLPDSGRRLWDLRERPDLVVEESTIALVPGGLPRFWSALEELGPEMPSPPRRDRLATWHSMTGRLHVVVSYTVFASMADRDAFHVARRANDATMAFAVATRDAIIANETAYLKPVQVPEMSPMFLLDK